MAFNGLRRMREIGVRLALGAMPAQIRAMMLRQGMRLLGGGLLLGFAGAFALSRRHSQSAFRRERERSPDLRRRHAGPGWRRAFRLLDSRASRLARKSNGHSARRMKRPSKIMNDLRFALRQLRKSPGFTALRSSRWRSASARTPRSSASINAVLLRPLPYHNSDRLIDFFSLDPAGERDGLSMAEFQDLRAQMHSLEDLAGFQSQSVNLTGGERPERMRGAFVSTNFFKVFQLTPVLGRTLVAGEDQPGAAKVAVVNEKLWRERLNGATDLANRS